MSKVLVDRELLEMVREALAYDRETGVLSWKKPTNQKIRIGTVAGCVGSNGYLQVKFWGRTYLAHRLAWLIEHGAFPEHYLDHINGNTTDNRLSNLRECTNSENQQNVNAKRTSSSRLLGVSLIPPTGKWRAQIRANGRKYDLGAFDSEELAYAAYLKAKAEMHKFQPVPRSPAMAAKEA
jgi:hypothetical protein